MSPRILRKWHRIAAAAELDQMWAKLARETMRVMEETSPFKTVRWERAGRAPERTE